MGWRPLLQLDLTCPVYKFIALHMPDQPKMSKAHCLKQPETLQSCMTRSPGLGAAAPRGFAVPGAPGTTLETRRLGGIVQQKGLQESGLNRCYRTTDPLLQTHFGNLDATSLHGELLGKARG